MSTQPSITISLNPVLEAYCRWVFATPPEHKEINITRHHCIGKHIFSHVLKSDLPVKRPVKNNPVVFTLPTTDNSFQALKNSFLFVDDWAEMKINDFIKADFDLWVRRRFESGYFYRLQQKEIIDAILRGLNLRMNAVNFDMIKKIDYRNRRKLEEKRFKSLLLVEL